MTAKPCPVCNSAAKTCDGERQAKCDGRYCYLNARWMQAETWNCLLLAPAGIDDPVVVSKAEVEALRDEVAHLRRIAAVAFDPRLRADGDGEVQGGTQ